MKTKSIFLILICLSLFFSSCSTTEDVEKIDNRGLTAKEFALDFETQATANEGDKPNAQITKLFSDSVGNLSVYVTEPRFKDKSNAYMCIIYDGDDEKAIVVRLNSPGNYAYRMHTFEINKRVYSALYYYPNTTSRTLFLERDGFSMIEPYTIK